MFYLRAMEFAPELHKTQRKDLPLFWYRARAPQNARKRPTTFLAPRQSSTKRKEKTYHFFGAASGVLRDCVEIEKDCLGIGL